MVIFGGLEIVAGGYLIHRHHKKKNEKKRLEDEALQRRHNTFPGANPPLSPGYSPSSPGFCPTEVPMMMPPPEKHKHPHPHPHPQQYPDEKNACYAPGPPSQPHFQPQPQPYGAPPLPHSQSFNVPQRSYPDQQPHIIQPLQRSDSFSTISGMPIANGSRPRDIDEEEAPALPPRRHATNLQPIPQQKALSLPYSNTGFSLSTPSFAPTPTSPAGVTYTTSPQRVTHAVDDNWETYGSGSSHAQNPPYPHHAPPAPPQLDDENDPPPPYMP